MLGGEQASEGRGGEGSGGRVVGGVGGSGCLGPVPEHVGGRGRDVVQFLQVDREQRRGFEDHPLTTPEKGADELVWLAESQPGADWEPGTYYEKRKPARRVNPQAFDASLAYSLWERSEQLIAPSHAR